MLGPAGASPAERWVAQGRAAAAQDLLQRLLASGGFEPVLILAADEPAADRLASAGGQRLEPPAGSFHFGRALAETIRRHRLAQLAYFGGASAPLVSEPLLQEALGLLRSGGAGTSVVNNLHSTDWALLGDAEAVLARPERFPSDNSLGWVLSREAGLPVLDLPPGAATRLDIDTPADVLLAAAHPRAGPSLAACLSDAPDSMRDALRGVRQVLQQPASQLTLIGRTSAHAWAELERRTQTWVRVFAEERGMLASGRLQRGEARSLLYRLGGDGSEESLVRGLAEISDGVLWDTRVWMAASGSWPSTADRFASDLGWAEQISEPGLRRLTLAIRAAGIPILAGGHGVVAGGLYALLESLDAVDFA
jgi:hypothetical protein